MKLMSPGFFVSPSWLSLRSYLPLVPRTWQLEGNIFALELSKISTDLTTRILVSPDYETHPPKVGLGSLCLRFDPRKEMVARSTEENSA
jgi:hypothetical protein